MKFSIAECERVSVTDSNDLVGFSCGDEDLDNFFKNESYLYSKQLLGKTYYFLLRKSNLIVGVFTVSNDSIKASLISNSVRNRIQRKIPNSKRTRSYPAILIGRLGVSVEMRGNNVGCQILDYIKLWFSSSANKSGCRYIVVDAYNQPKVLGFYEKNDFKYLYPTEDEEKRAFNIESEDCLKSRMMYFDLISYSDI